MWKTPSGVRCLEGAEACLFKTAAGIYQDILLDMVKGGEDLSNNESSDRWESLPWQQQIIAMGHVTKDLTSPYTEAPELYAWNELTIHHVFEFLLDSEDIEHFGSMVLRTLSPTGKASKKKIRALTPKTFNMNIEEIRAGILMDREIDRTMIKKAKKGGLGALGLRDDYFAQLFPAFSVRRYEDALLNEERLEEAMGLLPAVVGSRYQQGIELKVEEDAEEMPWFPVL